MIHYTKYRAEKKAEQDRLYRATARIYWLISIFAIYYPLWIGLSGLNA